jgi:NTE family protein
MSYGCQTRMHVVQLLAPQLDHEDHTKDVDFSPPAFDGVGALGTPTPRRCLRASPGSTNSIRYPV